MRIYSNARELMSEMGRDLWEMGIEVKPKTYQNKVIENNDDFITKEEMCKQYCLTALPDPEFLFVYTNDRGWADAEFEERVSGEGINPGTAYLKRKEVWEQFLVQVADGYIFDYTYSERMSLPVHSLESQGKSIVTALEAIIQLLKIDPDTRKAVLPIFIDRDLWNLDGSKRIPCSMYYSFLIRQGKLNMTYHQRSSDFVTHFGNDVYLAWKLKDYVAEKVGIESGSLIHTIDSLHSYKKDWHILKTSVDTFHSMH